MENIGKVVQIIGPVIDVRFSGDNLPNLHNAIKIEKGDGTYLTVEVAQHVGDDVVRTISMGATDGFVRGAKAIDTGSPISVPVGDAVLGRMFNVLGDPIDGLGDWSSDVCSSDLSICQFTVMRLLLMNKRQVPRF